MLLGWHIFLSNFSPSFRALVASASALLIAMAEVGLTAM